MDATAGGRAPRRVVMLATENDALKGAKVGGIGDVIRDLPGELVPLGWRVTVLIPSYGFLHRINPSEKVADVTFPFGGREEFAEIFRAAPQDGAAPSEGAAPSGDAVEHLLLHHPGIAGDPIYFHDPKERVFARDSTKFALFCSAAGQYLRTLDEPYVLHLHDWHTGYLFLLAELHPAFRHLRPVRKVFTIHNIGYQGTRPLRKHSPAVEEWYPELFRKSAWIREWKDPRYEVPTFTPMLAGIRHAAAVTTVSPTYAREITRAGDHANAIPGGEGLEDALRLARDERRLHGILNGVEYPPRPDAAPMDDARFLAVVRAEIACGGTGGAGAKGNDADGRRRALCEEALRRLVRRLDGSNPFLLTSITRISEQKVRLMLEKGSDGLTALESILRLIAGRNAAWVFIGSGSERFEAPFREAFERHESFIFLNGFHKESAAALFRRGNLFVMPSAYEPCGITQMMAMREGQPCLVHAVGGLRDTVSDGVNGFSFDGTTLVGKVDNFTSGVRRALELRERHPARWEGIVRAARESRFGWGESAKAYDRVFRGVEPAE